MKISQKWHPLQMETLKMHVKHHVRIWDLGGNLGPVGLSKDCTPSIYYRTMAPSHTVLQAQKHIRFEEIAGPEGQAEEEP